MKVVYGRLDGRMLTELCKSHINFRFRPYPMWALLEAFLKSTGEPILIRKLDNQSHVLYVKTRTTSYVTLFITLKVPTDTLQMDLYAMTEAIKRSLAFRKSSYL